MLEVRGKKKKSKKNVGLLDLDYSHIWLNPSKDDHHLAFGNVKQILEKKTFNLELM